jgi:hypothetical protein
MAELMLKEEEVNVKKADIASNERITMAQMAKDKEYVSQNAA